MLPGAMIKLREIMTRLHRVRRALVSLSPVSQARGTYPEDHVKVRARIDICVHPPSGTKCPGVTGIRQKTRNERKRKERRKRGQS
ncbi:hypothetical protein OBBRIDRAFT_237396 [Obba rivulosa]|uniref:Uncharacterized protein n=1 Tax=Obba rivulosa TaxID=1052685 RepID=A0A8E2J7B7_9APHY|nr:hypothetical protein OBBRIDRAFT_237396 [Obba rivulosa]